MNDPSNGDMCIQYDVGLHEGGLNDESRQMGDMCIQYGVGVHEDGLKDERRHLRVVRVDECGPEKG